MAQIAWAKKKFGLPDDARLVSCYEAGREDLWLHRFLESEGVPPRSSREAACESP